MTQHGSLHRFAHFQESESRTKIFSLAYPASTAAVPNLVQLRLQGDNSVMLDLLLIDAIFIHGIFKH